MSKVTNLNKLRKSRARSAKRAAADENAVKFGRSKDQKTLEQSRADKAARSLDAHQRDDA